MPVVVTKIVPRYVHHQVLVKRLESPPRSPWGDILREIREEQGISQRSLAELAGVNRNVLRRLEKNEGSSSVDVIERISAVLGYSLDLHSEQRSIYDI